MNIIFGEKIQIFVPLKVMGAQRGPQDVHFIGYRFWSESIILENLDTDFHTGVD